MRHRATRFSLLTAMLATSLHIHAAAAQGALVAASGYPSGMMTGQTILGSGYDPMQSAVAVTSGAQTLQQASTQNIQNARAAEGSGSTQAGGSSSGGASSGTAKTDASAAMGGDLAGSPTASIMDDPASATSSAGKGTSASASASETASDGAAAGVVADPISGVSENDPNMRGLAALARADRILKEAGGGKGAPPSTPSAKGATASTATTPADAIVAGPARALDSVTLSVGGHTVILNGLSGPGNGQVCYRDALPWNCGEDGQAESNRLVAGLHIACRVDATRHGHCVTADGADVAGLIAARGYASIAKADPAASSISIAEIDHLSRDSWRDDGHLDHPSERMTRAPNRRVQHDNDGRERPEAPMPQG